MKTLILASLILISIPLMADTKKVIFKGLSAGVEKTVPEHVSKTLTYTTLSETGAFITKTMEYSQTRYKKVYELFGSDLEVTLEKNAQGEYEGAWGACELAAETTIDYLLTVTQKGDHLLLNFRINGDGSPLSDDSMVMKAALVLPETVVMPPQILYKQDFFGPHLVAKYPTRAFFGVIGKND